MTVARPTAFWITIAIIVLVMLVLLREILLPFAVGLALAYLLVPAVDKLEQVGIDRGLAALILILVLGVGVVGVLLVMLPAIIGELKFFLDEFPRYVTQVQALVADTGRPWLHQILGQELRIDESVTHTTSTIGSAWVDDLVRSAWLGGKALFSLLSLLVVVPIVCIYLLTDWDRMIALIDGWVPAQHREDVRALGREIHETVAGFVRGQIVICLILAVFYAGSLRLTGLNHSIPIGATAGLISFVPYLGLGVGFVVAACVAIAQFWPDWTPLAAVAGIFLIGETIADYVLAPRIIGTRVKLNPVWLMFALFAFGYLFGFVGLLVAIPLAASLGVVLRFAMRKSLVSTDLDVTAPFASDVIPQRQWHLDKKRLGGCTSRSPPWCVATWQLPVRAQNRTHQGTQPSSRPPCRARGRCHATYARAQDSPPWVKLSHPRNELNVCSRVSKRTKRLCSGSTKTVHSGLILSLPVYLALTRRQKGLPCRPHGSDRSTEKKF